jgi:hypothetical protein
MCKVGGATNDLFIIQFLPIYLAESARAWVDHLFCNAINCWDNLWEVFTGNFHGTYASSSLSIWLNLPGPGWTISFAMPSIVGTTYGRTSPAISMAPMCALATTGN